jgi:hypothetical protein
MLREREALHGSAWRAGHGSFGGEGRRHSSRTARTFASGSVSSAPGGQYLALFTSTHEHHRPQLLSIARWPTSRIRAPNFSNSRESNSPVVGSRHHPGKTRSGDVTRSRRSSTRKGHDTRATSRQRVVPGRKAGHSDRRRPSGLARTAGGHRAPEAADGLGDALLHHHRQLRRRLRRG